MRDNVVRIERNLILGLRLIIVQGDCTNLCVLDVFGQVAVLVADQSARVRHLLLARGVGLVGRRRRIRVNVLRLADVRVNALVHCTHIRVGLFVRNFVCRGRAVAVAERHGRRQRFDDLRLARLAVHWNDVWLLAEDGLRGGWLRRRLDVARMFLLDVLMDWLRSWLSNWLRLMSLYGFRLRLGFRNFDRLFLQNCNNNKNSSQIRPVSAALTRDHLPAVSARSVWFRLC